MITDPDIERYATEHTSPLPDFMAAIAADTREHLQAPEMLIGELAGRFLEFLTFALRARRVLELGTYSGYSALAMASGMGSGGGEIITCERDPEHAAIARRNIAASPFADMIDVREGAALDLLAGVEGPFDLIFIDADKPSYPAYFEACLPLLADRGLMALDNMLREGDVLHPADEGTRVLAELNDQIAADPRVVQILLPLRDGLVLVHRAG
ncbi:MAG: O-methyltransferase [Solirubrobacterales bacterium]|nr:O-methyltransferase [Solirubrobacterales bacterium]